MSSKKATTAAPLAPNTVQNQTQQTQSQRRNTHTQNQNQDKTTNSNSSTNNVNNMNHIRSNGATAQGQGAKNVKRKSSKPIINWLQRKLAGTVRSRRVSDSENRDRNAKAGERSRATSLRELRGQMAQNVPPMPVTARGQNGIVAGREGVADENGYSARQPRAMSNEISLNSTDDPPSDDDAEAESMRRSSGGTGAAGSLWGSMSLSRSAPAEADEDASIRPLPPTSPPSPSPSRSSSSYLSDPRTFKSMSASTKPTTLLSIDLTNGPAHIAQAPPTPTSVTFNTQGPTPSPIQRFPPHVRTSSSGPGGAIGSMAITFSSLPSPQATSRPSSLNPLRSGALQAPAHTAHHPRNNPRPASPPRDDASVLTLASSAFGFPASSGGRWAGAGHGAGAGDSMSHLGGGDSMSHIVLDGDGFMVGGEDKDASVRALRPRSERRNSWESEASRWSAGVSILGAGGLGGMGRERSLRTAPSFRTGGQGTSTVDDQGSMNLGDDDEGMTRDGGDDCDADERDRAFSPMSAVSFEGVPEEDSNESATRTEENGTSASHSAQTVNSEGHELDYELEPEDVSTPGPAGRTIALADPAPVPSPLPEQENLAALDRTANEQQHVEPQTTPKKERTTGVLEDITQNYAAAEKEEGKENMKPLEIGL